MASQITAGHSALHNKHVVQNKIPDTSSGLDYVSFNQGLSLFVKLFVQKNGDSSVSHHIELTSQIIVYHFAGVLPMKRG